MDLRLARVRKDRRLDLGHFRVDGRDARVARGFADHGDAQLHLRDELRRHDALQPRQAFFVKQRLQLVRRSGQQDDDALGAIQICLQPLSRRGAARIAEHLCAVDDVGLTRVVVRHRTPHRSEPCVYLGDDLGIAKQLDIERLGHRFPREIVFGRPESAHEDDDVRAPKRDASDTREVRA
jgi:hypothetical protein